MKNNIGERSKHVDEQDEGEFRQIMDYPLTGSADENEEVDHSEEIDTAQSRLEKIYGQPLRRLDEQEKEDLIDLVSQITDGDGKIELKRLILENRLPITVENDEDWYTDWYAFGYSCQLFDLLFEVRGRLRSNLPNYDSPSHFLRFYLGFEVLDQINWLERLQDQLINAGEKSKLIEKKIERLRKLNVTVPFSEKELSKILN